MLQSARFLLHGPVRRVGIAVSVGFTGVALFQVVRDDSFWMWLCFAAVALAAVSFYELYRHHSETERKAQERKRRILALPRS
jgi:hypothetical protein